MEFSEVVVLRTFAAFRCVFHRFSESSADPRRVHPHAVLDCVLHIFDRKGFLQFDKWSVNGLRMAILGTQPNSPFRGRLQRALNAHPDKATEGSDISEFLGDALVPLVGLMRSAAALQDTMAESCSTLALAGVHRDLETFLSMLLCVPVGNDITMWLPDSITGKKYYHPMTIRSLAKNAVLQLIHASRAAPPDQFHRILLANCLRQLSTFQRDADSDRFLSRIADDESELLFLQAVHHLAVRHSERQKILAVVYGGIPLEAFFPDDDTFESHASRSDHALHGLLLAFRKILQRI